MENKVRVYSNVNHPVYVIIPGVIAERVWRDKGASVAFDRETLEEAMFDRGFRNMIEQKVLYIEDLDFLKEVGLEDEDATEVTKMAVMTDEQKSELLTVLNLNDFKAAVDNLTAEEVNSLVDYAVSNKIMNMGKSNYLKQKCGRDIIKIISLTED